MFTLREIFKLVLLNVITNLAATLQYYLVSQQQHAHMYVWEKRRHTFIDSNINIDTGMCSYNFLKPTFVCQKLITLFYSKSNSSNKTLTKLYWLFPISLSNDQQTGLVDLKVVSSIPTSFPHTCGFMPN